MADTTAHDELLDHLAAAEAHRARAVEEAIANGTKHLEDREVQRAQRAAATRTGADENPAGG